MALLCILNSDFIWFYIGGSILLYQTFIYPHILKAYGPINASRIAAVSTNYLSANVHFDPKEIIIVIIFADFIYDASFYLSTYDAFIEALVIYSSKYCVILERHFCCEYTWYLDSIFICVMLETLNGLSLHIWMYVCSRAGATCMGVCGYVFLLLYLH